MWEQLPNGSPGTTTTRASCKKKFASSVGLVMAPVLWRRPSTPNVR